jgi:di/tricarboxylate transporter
MWFYICFFIHVDVNTATVMMMLPIVFSVTAALEETWRKS